MRVFYSMLFLIVPFFLTAQKFSKDSLQLLEDEELLSLFSEVEYDSIQAEFVANVYLERAKNQSDTIKMARAYERLGITFGFEKNMKYVDTLITLTKNIKNVTYPGQGYLLRGYLFSLEDDLINSTKSYLKAYEVAKRANNRPQELTCSNSLIISKAKWGNREDALQMALENYEVIRSKSFYEELKNTTRSDAQNKVNQYMNELMMTAISHLAFCYHQVRNVDSAKHFINAGRLRLDSLNPDDRRMMIEFDELEIEVNYFAKQYNDVVKSSNNMLAKWNDELSAASKRNVFLFKGLSESKLNILDNGIAVSYTHLTLPTTPYV